MRTSPAPTRALPQPGPDANQARTNQARTGRIVRAWFVRLAAAQKPLRAPPSTGSISPVRYEAAGDSRKAAVRPNSSGVP